MSKLSAANQQLLEAFLEAEKNGAQPSIADLKTGLQRKLKAAKRRPAEVKRQAKVADRAKNLWDV